MLGNNDSERYAQQLASDASNIRIGDNPPYLVSDFLAIYPQFGTTTAGVVNVPIVVIQMYIDLAQACIKQARWHTSWLVAMSLFIAHFTALWLRGTSSVDDTKDAIIDASYTEGILTGSSVDGVSYSMDISSAADDLQGYGAWKSTSYGIQLATLSKIYGMGGMVVR